MNKLATLALWVMCLMALLSLSTAAYQDYSQSNKQYQQKSYNNDPIKCNPNVRYADGFCNNPWNPFWGWTGDLLLRKEGVQYTDGLWEPVYRGNERTISNMFFADEYYDKNPETQPYDIKKKRDGPHAHEHNLNNLHIIFGQLLTHDIGWFPAEHVRSSLTWKRHAPYKIPLVDHYDVLRESNKGKNELMVSPGEGAWIDDRFYPWNNSTAFIDCSPIYGSTEEVAMKLRLRKDGKLIGSDKKTHRGLPHLSQVKVHNDCSNTSPTGHAAGDVRVNENIGLTALHTIFHDEHNRICDDIISKVGRGKWSDEKIYQEARRIVIALMQRITMEEFLPLLLINPHNKDSEKIIREAIGSYKGYNRWVHPGIMNAFASSAFRVSHDLINLPLLVLDNKCNVIPSPEINVGGAQRDQPYMQSSSSRYPIYAQNSDDKSYSDNRDYEKQPYLGERTMCIPEHFDKVPGGVSSIFRGLINQMAQKQDSKIANYLRNVRTGTYSGVGNLDIEALHVYRGRLHGLPDYNTLRKYFGGKDLRSEKNCGRDENGNDSLECFMGVTKNKETARKLQKFYRSCDNIDAFVGMVIEDKEDWSSLPPTTTRIIITQFKNLRDGDRFWYENRESKLFAEEEIKGIKKTSLADIIRRNTNGLYDDEIPRDIFHVPSKSKCFSKY